MSGKYALIIANTKYTDPSLAQLTAPGKDAQDLAHVLKDPEIGAFDDVKILLDQLEHTIRRSIDEFFDQKKPDDLLILYFSGHGVRDELGALYLAVPILPPTSPFAPCAKAPLLQQSRIRTWRFERL